MDNDEFFSEQSEQSKIKAQIVNDYFVVWAKIIIAQQKKSPHQVQRIGYIDLFAGPGRYRDEAASTPVEVIQAAIQDPDIRERLVAAFNDKNPENTRSLRECLEQLPGYSTLNHTPQIHTEEVTADLIEDFEKKNLIPSFLFVDPWGYKGLSLRLVNSVLKNWGCDCVFFFNYNRLNSGISNKFVNEHIEALFGPDRANRIRTMVGASNAPAGSVQTRSFNPQQREQLIIEEMCSALKEMGGQYVLPFRFRDDRGTRTTHHLFFVSKHFRGYERMKDIMHKHSSRRDQGVAGFEYNPADSGAPTLMEFARPLADLEEMVLQQYAGRTVHRDALYEQHSVGRPFIESHYRELVLRLEAEGKVSILTEKRRQSGKLPTDARIVFPKQAVDR